MLILLSYPSHLSQIGSHPYLPIGPIPRVTPWVRPARPRPHDSAPLPVSIAFAPSRGKRPRPACVPPILFGLRARPAARGPAARAPGPYPRS